MSYNAYRPIPSLSASAGAPCGVTVSNTRYFFLRYGSNILGATITGSTAQCAKLRRYKLPSLCHRRMGRCLQQRDSPALGRAQGAAQRPHRTLGPSLPHDGVPGPAIGFLQEALRWWDHWLKGNDTGIMAADATRLDAGKRPAEAVLQTSPRPLGGGNPMALAAYHLQTSLARCRSAEQRSNGQNPTRFSLSATTGLGAGEWCGFGAPEKRRWISGDDGCSLTFDSSLTGKDRNPGCASSSLGGFGRPTRGIYCRPA